MTNGRGKADPMSKAQGSLNPLRDAGKWGGEGKMGRGKRRELQGPEITGSKVRACRFPSLRNLGHLLVDITRNQARSIPASSKHRSRAPRCHTPADLHPRACLQIESRF